MQFRDFRTSAIMMMFGVLAALFIIMYFGGSHMSSEVLSFVAGTVLGSLGTAIVKLSDDGGESDAVKVTRMFTECECACEDED